MCFVLEEDNAIFTGDNVLGHGTAAVEMLSLWMDSLRLMQAQQCKIGYPAHGMVIPDLPNKITGELASKVRREKQVLKALSKIKISAGSGRGDATVKEIVTVMYGEGMADEVRQMAIEPFMEEVLRKLSEDGKVAFTVRGGMKKWFQIVSD
jgi:glyoxylase-like metal-dependent hydrolase (beta-lactamase superfamily II)